MSATLKVRPAEKKPFTLQIAGTATIGRSRSNVVSLDFSPQVSRQHAVIRCLDESQYQIMDLGSRNGTFVNGRQVIMPTTLSHGDLIRITDNELLFEQVASPDPLPVEEDRTLPTSTGIVQDYSATVAMMVCDIRGFSTMSEILPQKELAQTLGKWFRVAGDLIHETGERSTNSLAMPCSPIGSRIPSADTNLRTHSTLAIVCWKRLPCGIGRELQKNLSPSRWPSTMAP